MRIIRLPDTVEGRGAWNVAWVAMMQYSVGDRAQTLTLRRLRRALKKVAIVTVPDAKQPEQELLRPKGGLPIVLEEAEHGLLVKAVDLLRAKLNGGDVEPLALLDEVLEQAKEVSSDDVERALSLPELT
jgi:hypothetical protein